MRDNNRLFEGVLLIGLGVLLLLNMLGTIPWSIWANVLHYWPILLIVAGVAVVFRQRVPFFGLIALFLLIAVLLSVTIPGFNPVDGFTINIGTTGGKHTGGSAPLAAAAASLPLKATLSFRAADLTVNGDTDQAYDVSIDYHHQEPTISSTTDTTGTKLVVKEPETPSAANHNGDRWRVSLNPDVPLALTVASGACDANLDLTRCRLTDLTVSAGAGEYKIKVGERSPLVKITISAAATDVRLTVPANAGVRMHASGVLMDTNFADAGLVKSGEFWISPGYDTAAQKIEAEISGAVGDIHIIR